MSKIKDNGTLKDAHEFYKKNSAGTGLEYIEELYRKNSQGQLEKIFDAGWDTTVTSIPATLSNARAKPTSWEIKGKSQQSRLPDGYTEVEYIQSSGTQYIDTGIIMTESNIEYELDMMFDTLTSGGNYAGVLGADLNYQLCIKTENGYWSIGNADSNTQAVINHKYHANGIISTVQSDTTYYIDGTDIGLRRTCGINTKILLFTTNGNTYNMRGKIYYTKMYRDNMLICNFIPAKNSSNVLGMYDTVTNTFFTNAGTGTFTAGPALPSPTSPVDVKGVGNSGLPSGYKKLEYIQSSGTQYIDLGFKANQDTIIETTFDKTNYSSTSFLYGARTSFSSNTYQLQITPSSFFQYNNGETMIGVLSEGTHTFKQDKQTAYLDGVNKGSRTYSTFETPTNMILFARSSNSTGTIDSYARVNIRSFKAWDNTNQIRNLVPAKRKSDNVIGMYDTITNTFFTNAATTGDDFIAGPEDTSCVVPVMVNREVPLEYKQLEYIESTGTQHIDTGLLLSVNDIVSIKYAFVNGCASYGTVFGSQSGSAEAILRRNSDTLNLQLWRLSYTEDSPDKPTDIVWDRVVESKLNAEFGSSYGIYLFASNRTDSSVYYSKSKIYHYGVYRNSSLVINLIPAQRTSDSVIGMYDTVSKAFFTNSGTGTFTAGPEVGIVYNISLSAPLQKVGTYTDSIESDGTLTRGVGKLILTGTEDWTYSNNAIYARLVYANIPLYGLCSHFNYSTASIIAEMDDGEFIYNKSSGATNGNLSLKSSLFTDLSTAKSWLAAQYAAGTPVIIYYPLATATETTVQVPTINTVKGTNYLDIQTEVEPSSVSITYRKRTSA